MRPGRGALAALMICVTALPCALGGCAPAATTSPHHRAGPPAAGGRRPITSWVYQLQNYPDGRLDELARAPQPLAVIDLARDAGCGYFRRAEIGALRRTGKTVLAYFEIGSIEDFRPEYGPLRRHAGATRRSGSPATSAWSNSTGSGPPALAGNEIAGPGVV